MEDMAGRMSPPDTNILTRVYTIPGFRIGIKPSGLVADALVAFVKGLGFVGAAGVAKLLGVF
jgi:hypothetical protein